MHYSTLNEPCIQYAVTKCVYFVNSLDLISQYKYNMFCNIYVTNRGAMKKSVRKNLIIFAAAIVMSAAFATAVYADDVPKGQASTEGQAAFAEGETESQAEENIAEGQASTEGQAEAVSILDDMTKGPLSYYETAAYDSEYEKNARVGLINYARQFCGCPYRWGGINPLTGADCSGFVLHCVDAVTGIVLPHSSRDQATIGHAVTYEQLTPGDLVFYASGSRIDHVAIYIGGDLIVHAVNERKGIMISSLWHRNPVCFTSLF